MHLSHAWHLGAMTTLSSRSYLLAALLGGGQLAYGQAAPCRYPSAARSNAWLDSARRLPLPQQLAAVRARMLADTVMRHPQSNVCLMPLSAAQRAAYYQAQQPREQAEAARPAGGLLLYVVDGESLATNYPAPTNAFLQKMAAYRVQHIEFLSGPVATALYGTRGANGVVVLSGSPPKHR
jgi:TonB-dependent SusC/RagA subfamily outer membrane receptor